jgi:Leucine-rich repeat (LRR) protein
MWGDSHEAENPIIINGQSCANCENSYPMMYWFGDNYTDLVFIDHNMVFNYFNSYTVFYTANLVIQNMLDALPDSGDLNDDGIVNILDIILMINMILDSNYNDLADINQDGIVDILDIVALVNWIMNDVPEPGICNGLTEVELWGECYNIETTTEIDLSGDSSNGWEGGLTGEIPSEIGNLINLNYLNLGHNDLNGSIPPEIGNLTNLIYLVIHFNQFTGEIPQEICDLIESNNLDVSWILNGNELIYTCD